MPHSKAEVHEEFLLREHRRNDPAPWSASSRGGMIATAHYLATAAGAELLAGGGNAVDAALAASFALSVCEPAESGLGGMGMMLIHHRETDRVVAVAGACRAPRHATRDEVARHDRYRGYHAVAVPMLPAVIDHALRHYGSRGLDRIIAPAIRIAEEGYPVTPLQYRMAKRYHRILAQHTAAPFLLGRERRLLRPGTWFSQPVLANTLRRLRDYGLQDFYRGGIAREIVDDMRAHGGFVQMDDLDEFSRPQEQSPLSSSFQGAQLFTLGPPGGGVTVIEMLNLFAAASDCAFDADSPEGTVLLAGIIRRARSDRERYSFRFGADRVGNAGKLLSTQYARMIAAQLGTRPRPGGGTSHISVMDRYGNAVSMTQSLDRDFGAAAASPDLGFLYNDYMNTFNIKNEHHPHFLRPGAKARSNAAPSLLFKQSQPWAAIGAAGSGRIPSAIFQVLVRLRTQSPYAAVKAPRLHCTPEGNVTLEIDRFAAENLQALREEGYSLKRATAYSHSLGGLQLVVREDGLFEGVADPRRDGAAAGP